MRRSFHLLVLCFLLVSSTVLSTSAQDATPGSSPAAVDSLLAELGYPEIRVTTDGTTHDFPTELEAGRYHVAFENQSNLDIDLSFQQPPEGVTVDEVLTAEAAATPPDVFFDMVFNGGIFALAGETKGVVLDLTPGNWFVNLFMFNPATNEDTNTRTAIAVTGEMPDLDEPPGHEIDMVDLDFVVSQPLDAGPQIWSVTNEGQELHQLTLERVPEGTTEDQVIEFVTSSIAPPTTPGAVATPVEPVLIFEDFQAVFFGIPLSPGRFNLYELDLEPGTYALTCFVSDPNGTPYAMLGMVEIVTVE